MFLLLSTTQKAYTFICWSCCESKALHLKRDFVSNTYTKCRCRHLIQMLKYPITLRHLIFKKCFFLSLGTVQTLFAV